MSHVSEQPAAGVLDDLDLPIPYSPPLEDAFLPGAGRIAAKIRARVR